MESKTTKGILLSLERWTRSKQTDICSTCISVKSTVLNESIHLTLLINASMFLTAYANTIQKCTQWNK